VTPLVDMMPLLVNFVASICKYPPPALASIVP
jgi:hypothetical protein